MGAADVKRARLHGDFSRAPAKRNDEMEGAQRVRRAGFELSAEG